MEAIPSASGESPAADGFFSLSQGRSFDYPDVARITNYRMGDSWRATEPLSVSGVCTHVGNRRSSNDKWRKLSFKAEKETKTLLFAC